MKAGGFAVGSPSRFASACGRRSTWLLLAVLLAGTFLLEKEAQAQGMEDFENMPASSTAYQNRSWTGTDGVTWTATEARTDQNLTGRAICTRGGGTVTSPAYAGGMGVLEFNYVRG